LYLPEAVALGMRCASPLRDDWRHGWPKAGKYARDDEPSERVQARFGVGTVCRGISDGGGAGPRGQAQGGTAVVGGQWSEAAGLGW